MDIFDRNVFSSGGIVWYGLEDSQLYENSPSIKYISMEKVFEGHATFSIDFQILREYSRGLSEFSVDLSRTVAADSLYFHCL